MAVPLPLHVILEGKQASPLRCRLIAQIAEGAELMVYPGSDGLSAAHADQLNADLTDFVKTRIRGRPGRGPHCHVIALGA
jgi:hypothetical protein